jgi:hypothetical protein
VGGSSALIPRPTGSVTFIQPSGLEIDNILHGPARKVADSVLNLLSSDLHERNAWVLMEKGTPENWGRSLIHETRQCRHYVYWPGLCRAREDCMAVHAVSSEPLSGCISLLTGNLTGKF